MSHSPTKRICLFTISLLFTTATLWSHPPEEKQLPSLEIEEAEKESPKSEESDNKHTEDDEKNSPAATSDTAQKKQQNQRHYRSKSATTPDELPDDLATHGYEEAVHNTYVDSIRGILAPHGLWRFHEQYGWLWTPTGLAEAWQPYTEGRWAYTRYGWTWSSTFTSWGWLAFHYGRWLHLDDSRWWWVPGRRWGSAWVFWHGSGNSLAWAPMPPLWGPYHWSSVFHWGGAWVYIPRERFTHRHSSARLRRRIKAVIESTTPIGRREQAHDNDMSHWLSGPKSPQLKSSTHSLAPEVVRTKRLLEKGKTLQKQKQSTAKTIPPPARSSGVYRSYGSQKTKNTAGKTSSTTNGKSSAFGQQLRLTGKKRSTNKPTFLINVPKSSRPKKSAKSAVSKTKKRKTTSRSKKKDDTLKKKK